MLEIVTLPAWLRYDVGQVWQVHETTAKNGSQSQPALVRASAFSVCFKKKASICI
jgi:hypothetical protein